MQSFLWEHFESAVRYFIIGFWILLTGITFSLEWHDNLDMSFWPKCATINHWHSGLDTLIIYIQSRLDIIKSISHDCLALKEQLGIDIWCAIMNFVQACWNMSFHAWVHLNCSGCSCCRLWLTKMLLPEEELPIQITNLNDIWICQNDMPISGSKTKHGIIFKQLTSNGSSSNHKQLAVLNLLIEWLPIENDGA